MHHKTLLAIAVWATLSACSNQPASEQGQLSVPEQWQHAAATAGSLHTDVLLDWWQGFDDPILNELITKALQANQDIQIAQSRVQEAQAMVTIGESRLYPNLDLTASGGQEKSLSRVFGVPGPTGMKLLMPTGNAVSGGLAASWEIDLFGGRHHEAAAMAAQSSGIAAELQSMQLALVAQMASHYLELRGLQAHIVLQQQQLELQQKRLTTLHRFYQQGLVNATAVAQQQSQIHSNQATLTVLNQQAETQLHRLGVLSGQTPSSLEALLKPGTGSGKHPALPDYLPSDLLSQRPDLKMAKAQVTAAADNLGAAKANLFPRLVLSVNGGYGLLSAGGFPTLTDSIYTLGSGLTAPIFSAGRIQAQISIADAHLQQAAAQYEKTFLLAMEDVENAYVGYSTSQERLQQMQQAETAAEQAQSHSESLYKNGASDYLTTLDAALRKLLFKDEAIKAETALRVATVSLYRAFGGGWQITAEGKP